MLWKIGFDPTACNMTCSRRLTLKHDFDDNIDALMQREVSQQLCADDEAFLVRPVRPLDREYWLYMFLVATWFLVVPSLLGILIRRYCGTAAFECCSENENNVAAKEGIFYRSVCRGIILYEYASEAFWFITMLTFFLVTTPDTEAIDDKKHRFTRMWWQNFVGVIWVLPWLKRKLIDVLLDATNTHRCFDHPKWFNNDEPEDDFGTRAFISSTFEVSCKCLVAYILTTSCITLVTKLFNGEELYVIDWPPECL